MKTFWISIILAASCLSSGSAWAEGHHHHGGGGGWGGGGWGGGARYGFSFGGPIFPYYGGYGYGWGGYPYGNPYPYPYYPPAVVTVPTAPPTYIQQAPPVQQQAPAANYWHYCSNPEGYYPYVKECPGGWQLVPPTPPPAQQ